MKTRFSKFKIFLIVFCFSYFFIPLFSVSVQAQTVKYIAHRGDMTDAPEQTYAAVDMAIKKGYKAFECDVWKTKSGDFLIHHDQDIYRLCGVHKNIKDLTERNRWNYPYKNTKYGRQYILTFEEMAKYAKALSQQMVVF